MTEDTSKIGFAKSLFLGNIKEELLFPYPKLDSEEVETLKMVNESIDKFLEDKWELFREMDVKGEMPEEFLNSLKELGLFATIIPEEFGGLGLSSRGYSRVVQQASKFDGSIAITMGAHSSIGMKGLLLFGNDEQKERYLSKLASGEMIAAFCLTEPGSGSDAASIKTKAKKNEDGSWTLDGEKLWITNGPIAQFYTVFARTNSEAGQISAFLVERSFEGITCGPKEDKMGLRASATTTVNFKNVKVPAENLLGEEGKGFKIAMNILNNGRSGLGGGSIGAMKTCIRLASEYANERKQFDTKIRDFGMIQDKIAQMTIQTFVSESLVNMMGYFVDSGSDDYSVEAAMTKVFSTDSLWFVANEALQIAGGNGFMREYAYERIVRDCRINLIFEGTNEILRLYTALTGMKEAGKFLKNIGDAAGNIFNDPIKGFGIMSDYAVKKLAQLTSIGGEQLKVHEVLRDEARVYELATLGLSKRVEGILKKYGKNIVGQQFISKRVSNAAIDLFAGLCTLSRVNTMIADKGLDNCKQEISIIKVFSQQAKKRIKKNLAMLERPEDDLMKDLSNYIVDQGGYKWDVI